MNDPHTDGGHEPGSTALPSWTPQVQIPDVPLEIPEPVPGQPEVRAVNHPAVLQPRGIPVRCPQCEADHDWLLIYVGDLPCGYVRCRCGHEWPEGELSRDYFDTQFTHTEQVWSSLDAAYRGLGFDGVFAGCYLS